VRFSHLFLGSNLDNMADASAKGRFPDRRDIAWAGGQQAHGERDGNAKLTENDIRLIRDSLDTPTVLARRFGVTPRNIRLIRNRQTWRHI